MEMKACGTTKEANWGIQLYAFIVTGNQDPEASAIKEQVQAAQMELAELLNWFPWKAWAAVS